MSGLAAILVLGAVLASATCPLIDEEVQGTTVARLAPRLADDLASAFNADAGSIDVRFVSYRAKPAADGFVRVDEAVAIDSSFVRSYADGIIRRHIPDSSCRHRYDMGGLSLGVDGNGELRGSVGVTYAKWICEDFDWICCRHLKCRKCRETLKTFVWQKSVTVNAIISAQVIAPTPECIASARNDDDCPYSLSLTERTELDDRGGVPGWARWLDDLLGKPMQKKIDSVRDNLPQLGELFRSDVFRPGETIFEKFHPLAALFAPYPGGPVFRVDSAAELRSGSYCARLPELRVHLKYLRSFDIGNVCHEVTRGESWESIALHHYGWNEFGRALMRVNPGIGALHPGMKLEVPALHTLMDQPEGERLMGPGYHLWGVAAQERGDAREHPQLATLNPHIKDPNLIYPGDLLRTKEVAPSSGSACRKDEGQSDSADPLDDGG